LSSELPSALVIVLAKYKVSLPELPLPHKIDLLTSLPAELIKLNFSPN
jgi:hypothetical protein